MKRLFLVLFAFVTSLNAFSQQKDVVEIAIGSPDHTTLVAAIQAAELVSTLKGKGPFTVFAPTNEAFNKLPAGTIEKLLRPENKEKLVKILTYHVVNGKLKSNEVIAAIKSGNGKAILTTLNGKKLTATMEKGKVKLTDEAGNSAHIIMTDLEGRNGVVHVIDAVVLP